MEILEDGGWWPTGDGRGAWTEMIFPDNYKFVGIKDREERGHQSTFPPSI